ncbi:putative iron-sulfur cluster-binding protein [Megasphaera vaginalis (ex Srinivasan et al. 2021)]|uniref:Putative iron-sulfur cluster-binding protein n=1 Tax=Megasphaera vaginalis (ex Srinivasan et al. 2021) TaxID=1111454 RepID=U7UHT6_9FIRM|nr:LUD domain-containing protein [Megasphaera vaginalis (ex Srinivasan et al. 2021)]ERT58013.1 putative iron-sulfur cluster-binding protein [Megasphaera vaginalis (ex Srinivasan et al. 2021)]
MREKVYEVKSYARDHMDEMIAEFTKNATANGAKVFVAHSPQEAFDYALKLAKDNNVKLVVKSKSMASEEMHFNQGFEAAGITAQETDLGEFINSIAGDTPSHMVMPAIHYSKEDVADLFTSYTKEKEEPIISEEVKTSRRVMRPKFFEAEMGVSGANVAVAETGTVITMTNEGNGRMVGTMPKMHLYIFGIEKFVAKMSDIRYIFKVLPRNGTAQNITTYLSFYTGASQVVTDPENDTRETKDFNIIILDTPERRQIIADEDYKDIFCCIRCAACLNVCPAFRLVGGHVYGGSIYTGGIGTLLTSFLNSRERGKDIQNICLQCGACNTFCGGKLDIAGMILKLRTKYANEDGLNPIHKFCLDTVADRHLFHSMLRIASVAQGALTKDQPMIRHLPMFLSGLTSGRSLPGIALQPFRDVLPTIKQDVPNPKGKIAIFTGCLLDFVYVDIATSVVKALNMAGYVVEMPLGQACCGAPAAYMGDSGNSKKAAEMNIEAMEAEKYDYIVSACPTCTHALRDYKDYFKDEPEMLKRAEELSKKTFDFSKLLHMLGGLPDNGDGEPLKITYHDSCHMKRFMGVTEEQRELLKNTKGVELCEMENCDKCCGFGGSYSIKYPEMSAPILEEKINNIVASNADVVAVDCPGCLLQIQGGLDARNLGHIKVKHTAQILVEKRNKG